MRKFIIISALCISGSAPVFASFSGFTYKRELTVQASAVSTHSATLSDFPVLVSTVSITLSTDTAAGGRLTSAAGYDLIFSTNSDCSFSVSWDTDTYNLALGSWTVWVKLPQVSSTTNTTFYMCYGNASVSSYLGISTMTWSSGYVGVWHLGEGDSTDAAFYKDRTVNANHGQLIDADGDTIATNGKIGGAIDFNGDADYIDVGSGASLNLTPQSEWSVEGWANLDIGNSGYLIGKTHSNSASRQWGIFYDTTVQAWVGASLSAGQTMPTGSWAHVAFVIRDVGGTLTRHFYLNGSELVGNTTLGSVTNSCSVYIGARPSAACTGAAFLQDGESDEIRVSNVARSNGWIQTSYNNQNSPGTFTTIGAEESSSVSAPAIIRRIIIAQ